MAAKRSGATGGVYPLRGARSAGTPRVRRRGGALELRIDGSFASRVVPGVASAGPVWDALASALLALPPRRRGRVLLLGLGGGSAARVVRALAPEARIVGVEIDPRVVALARAELGLDALDVDVRVEDARRFLARTRQRFDAVLEDVFVGAAGRERKPDWMLDEGLARAAARLRRGGVLASNALDEAREVAARLRERFPRVLRIAPRDYDNRIFVAGPARLAAARLRAAIARCEALAPTRSVLSVRRV